MDDVAFFAALDEKLQVVHFNPAAFLLRPTCFAGCMGHQVHAATLGLLGWLT